VAVKKAKTMISKLKNPRLDKEEFAAAILDLQNRPGVDGRSPNEIVFGTKLRSRVPIHHTAFEERWKKAAKEADPRLITIIPRKISSLRKSELKSVSRHKKMGSSP